MKVSPLLFVLFTGLLYGSAGLAAGPQEGMFRLATFNIRTPIDKPPNAWTCRVDRVRALIQRHGFDVMGLQEATEKQIDDVLTEGWAYVGVGRDDGKRGGEASCIFYKKARFEVLDSGTFWLSETPEVVGSKSWDTACTRICTWARMTDRKTGKAFVYFNTHLDHVSPTAKENGMALILKRIQAIDKGIPVLLTGDMNSGPESKPIALAKAVLKDAKAISRTPHTGPFGTSNSFNFKKEKTGRIDYIFVSTGVSVLTHATLDDSENALYPSDHFPVVAELVFE
jgi:endonuclease/exonuclease/phosphatase family metal-dependent hydrolase